MGTGPRSECLASMTKLYFILILDSRMLHHLAENFAAAACAGGATSTGAWGQANSVHVYAHSDNARGRSILAIPS